MNWYNIFSLYYDIALESLYRPYRKKAIQVLKIEPHSRVIDLACGTGQNLEHIIAQVGDSVQVLGIDFSAGMLEKARKKVQKYRWNQVKLLQKDARKVTLADFDNDWQEGTDRILCVLGLSVIPDWEQVFHQTFSLLKPGGYYVIMDVHAATRVPQSYIVELMARADLKRKVWEPLEQHSEEFYLAFLPGSPHIHGGKLFIASGRRVENC